MVPATLSTHDRIMEVRDLLHQVSGLRDPQAVQRAFGERLRSTVRADGYVAFSVRGLEPGQYKVTRAMTSRADFVANRYNPWKDWDSIPVQTGGWFGEMMADPIPRLFTAFNLSGDPVLGDALADFGSAVLCPLFDNGEALNWSLMLRHEPGSFTEKDIEDFLMQGNLVGRMTRNLVVQEELERVNLRLRNQLDEIASLQRAMLPQRLPKIPRLDLAASYLTSNEAGGDYYDFFPHDDGRWSFTIADVSGHGAGAATMVARMHAILHADPHIHEGPAGVLTRLNQRIAVGENDPNFITALFATWDPAERELTISNAGHHLPTRKPSRGGIGEVGAASNIPLGILEDIPYEQSTARLDEGDTLVLYTDGITEAFSPPPEREMFGLGRLHASLEYCSGEPPCVIDSVHERLFEHTRSRDRDDDQTILALKVGAA